MGFKKKTVFVVGAGAHRDYGMPTGPQLISNWGRWRHERSKTIVDDVVGRVAAAMSTVCRPSDHLRHNKPGIWAHDADYRESYADFLSRVDRLYDQLSGSPHDSIDALLSQMEPEWQDLGKMIISAMLLYEESVAVKIAYIGGWHRWLMQRCRPSVGHMQSGDLWRFQGLGVITFNYDRLFEFHIKTLAKNYGNPLVEIHSLPRMLHVYGNLRSMMDWMPNERRYCSISDPKDIANSAAGIRIADDRKANQKILNESESILFGSEQLVFLGFAFDEANMAQIGLHTRSSVTGLKVLDKDVKIYATAYEEDIDRVRRARNALGDREITWGKTGHGCVECLKSWGLE